MQPQFSQWIRFGSYAVVSHVRDSNTGTQRDLFLDAPHFRLASAANRLCRQHAHVSHFSSVDWVFRQPGSGNRRCYHRGHIRPSAGGIWNLHLGSVWGLRSRLWSYNWRIRGPGGGLAVDNMGIHMAVHVGPGRAIFLPPRNQCG